MRNGYSFLFFIVVLLTNCKSKSSKPAHTERDKTITQKNAFSELFLDSTRLENFIASQKMQDSAANRLRNFYNSRNYELHGSPKMDWLNKDINAKQSYREQVTQ